MKENKISLIKSNQSIGLSQDNLVFIFENLQPPFEHGVHLYRTPNRRDLFILDEWATPQHSRYTPSKKFLDLEKQLKESRYHYYGFFHNHNYTDKEDDEGDKLLILPSNADMWENMVDYMGIVRNFREFSDLRIFLHPCSDYPYPPKHFITIDTPLGRGTRVIKSQNGFLIEDEEKIEFEDNTGYIETSMLIQAM